MVKIIQCVVMTLDQWLDEKGMTVSAFAAVIGDVSARSVYRYCAGSRMPRRPIMARIKEATGGQVGPADFFNLSSQPPARTPDQSPAPVQPCG